MARAAGRMHANRAVRFNFIRPSLLMDLHHGSSYGYELTRSLQENGFLDGNVAPGMVYRHLRQMEEEGMVVSRWSTNGRGPAKRIYKITGEGKVALDAWVDLMGLQAEKINRFLAIYNNQSPKV